MTINFTIFIQFIHFFFAFIILKKLVLKPSVDIIEQEDEIKKNLLNRLNEEESILHKKEELKERLWQDSRHQFAINTPDIFAKQEIVSFKLEPVKSLKISDQDLDNIVKNMTNLVVDKVEHVKS